MRSNVVLVSCLLLLWATTAFAGENSAGKLAMHLVASEEYLDCADLLPESCEGINCDLSAAELEAANGYGYLAFIGYDVTHLVGVEFAVAGFPTGRSGPTVQGPFWCIPEALAIRDIFEEGGIASGLCTEPDPASGLVLLGYLSFHYAGEDPLYIEYTPSTFSHTLEPRNYFLDCPPGYEEDRVTYETGCVIKGEALDGPLCEAGGDSIGGESAGGLVWAMDLDVMRRDHFIEQFLGEDGYMLPGKEFPLPRTAEVLLNEFAEGGVKAAEGQRFPLPFIRFEIKGEPTWLPEDESHMRWDAEHYVGFLPVNPDGTFPEEGIDWWSWEHGRSLKPEKWVYASFEWSDPTVGIAVSFASGSLDFQASEGKEKSMRLGFRQGCVAAFDRASRRLAIAGYDEAACRWHLVVLDERGRVLLEDPWDVAPTTHFRSLEGGSSVLYAVWEDEETAPSRPQVHPIPKGELRRPVNPRDQASLGAYRVSLRTGRVTKVPDVPRPGFPEGERPDRRQPYSLDGRYRVKLKPLPKGYLVAYYDVSDPMNPVLLWEKWEGWSLQCSAVSANGDYVAEILSGLHYPEGPDGPSYDDWRTTLRLRGRDGRQLGSYTVPLEKMGLGPLVFYGPYLLVGYDGTRGSGCGNLYIHDMRVPWNLGEGGSGE